MIQKITNLIQKYPYRAIITAALVAITINCYPVIFCGKSFVSTKLPIPNGSDNTPTMWWEIPMAFEEIQALHHGELPLWNRSGVCGTPLLAQAISMTGDPLHCIVWAGNNTALAWDIKFLAAKTLFCIGIGIITLILLKNPGFAVLQTMLAGYAGIWFYITNHPAFFVISYAPWVLITAIKWLEPPSSKKWGAAWLLANLACFNAGHVETACILLLGLNGAAFANAILENPKNTATGIKKLTIGTTLFVGLTAPIWLSFLTALKTAYTAHETTHVTQLPLNLLPGLFENTYFQQPSGFLEPAKGLGTTLLIFVGCSLSLLNWKHTKNQRLAKTNLAALLFWTAGAFGIIPTMVFSHIPLLNHVNHIHIDFSYLIALHLIIQAGYGFAGLQPTHKKENILNLGFTTAILAGILVITTNDWIFTWGPTWNYLALVASAAVLAPLIYCLLQPKINTAGWTLIILIACLPGYRSALYNTKGNHLYFQPNARNPLFETNNVLTELKKENKEPFRITAIRNVPINEEFFNGDMAATYQLEDIRTWSPLIDKEYATLLKNTPGVGFTPWSFITTNLETVHPMLNMLNVKYILTQHTQKPPNPAHYTLHQNDKYNLYENQEAWPRAFFSNKINVLTNLTEFIAQLDQNPTISLPENQMDTQLRNLTQTKTPQTAQASNFKLSVNSTEFDIDAPSAGAVCLTETKNPGFTATANNKSLPIFTANYAFKGIYIDKPGHYHIKFTYKPQYWTLSWTLFWISAVLGTTLIAKPKKECINT